MARAIDGGITRMREGRLILAWQVAALSRQARLPPLEHLLARSRPRRRQTWQEQYLIMGQWAAVMRRIEQARKQ